MRNMVKSHAAVIAILAAMASATAAHAQAPAGAPATLVQTIDLNAWPGTPVTVVQPPPPQPAPGFSLTGIAFDPISGTIYVSDYATTNVYQIDSATGAVVSAVYTNGLYTTVDIGPSQDVPGTAPTVVLANPLTNRWMFTGEKGGAAFNATTFVEPLTARAMQSGAAWDPATDNIYAADGVNWFATNNAKFLLLGSGGCNAVAVNPITSRVYVSCGGNLLVYDGVVLSRASVKIPTPPLAVVGLNAQPTGLAVNPNTNRVYLANRTSLDVLDASTNQVVASIPGLPDQSTDYLIAGYMALPLPRPVAINAITNTIFVVNSVSSTISVFDGNTNTMTGTITVPVPDGAIVSQPFPLPPVALLSEIKPGNTIFDASAGALTTLGGAVAIAVNEAANLLYVAGVDGTISVFALDPVVTPPAVPASYTLGPWTMIGAGVTTTATVTLTQPAPAGGAVLSLSASDPKSVRLASTITVPAGRSSIAFAVQGNGVTVATTVALSASYNGGTAGTTLTVAPGDSLHVTSATYSKSQQLLQITATGTNAAATIVVQNAKTNAILGTMVNLGGGTFTYQQVLAAGAPAGVNLASNLGGKTGQGVALVP